MPFMSTGHILAFRSILKSEEIVCIWNVMMYNYYLKDNNKNYFTKAKRKKQKKTEEKEEREENNI